jgi:hypothetical protein
MDAVLKAADRAGLLRLDRAYAVKRVVTLTAGCHEISSAHPRLRIAQASDVMCSVAMPATHPGGGVAPPRSAVHALGKSPGLLRMAALAADQRDCRAARSLLAPGSLCWTMAFGAVERSVHGASERRHDLCCSSSLEGLGQCQHARACLLGRLRCWAARAAQHPEREHDAEERRCPLS